jgi:hypothetical protein
MHTPIHKIYPALASAVAHAWKPLAVALIGIAVLK